MKKLLITLSFATLIFSCKNYSLFEKYEDSKTHHYYQRIFYHYDNRFNIMMENDMTLDRTKILLSQQMDSIKMYEDSIKMEKL